LSSEDDISEAYIPRNKGISVRNTIKSNYNRTVPAYTYRNRYILFWT